MSDAAKERWLERGGLDLLGRLHEAAFVVRFAYAALAAALTPSIWRVATRGVTRRQVYYTAVAGLPWFFLSAALLLAVLTGVLIGVARAQGLSALGLELVLRVLPLELIPLVTALFVALRSGSAISVEIALRRSRQVFERTEAQGGDAMRDVFIPRIVACAFSVLALTALANALSFAVAYLSLYGLAADGADEFTLAVAHVFSLPMVAGLVAKCALFGILVAVVPIASALAVPPREDQVPVAVMRAMVRLFVSIAVVQALSLAAKYV